MTFITFRFLRFFRQSVWQRPMKFCNEDWLLKLWKWNQRLSIDQYWLITSGYPDMTKKAYEWLNSSPNNNNWSKFTFHIIKFVVKSVAINCLYIFNGINVLKLLDERDGILRIAMDWRNVESNNQNHCIISYKCRQ